MAKTLRERQEAENLREAIERGRDGRTQYTQPHGAAVARVTDLESENARLQARVEEAEEKARKYDAWFEKGRCPACHFTEKHMASCLVGILQARVEEGESVRAILAELHDSIASQLEAAGYVTPTPVAVEQLLALSERRKEVLERHFPESVGYRADGERDCHYCRSLVSLDPHKPECPRAAIEEEEK